LQIYASDFLYADAHVQAPQQVVETGGASVSTSAEDLLNLASQKLLEIAEPASVSGAINPADSRLLNHLRRADSDPERLSRVASLMSQVRKTNHVTRFTLSVGGTRCPLRIRCSRSSWFKVRSKLRSNSSTYDFELRSP